MRETYTLFFAAHISKTYLTFLAKSETFSDDDPALKAVALVELMTLSRAVHSHAPESESFAMACKAMKLTLISLLLWY